MALAIEGALDPRSKEFRDAVKLTPATLAHYRTGGAWIPVEHLLYVSAIIAAEVTMGDARIIIEIPPRHGKSELCSVHTPVWFLEKFPWANVILTTYAEPLAVGFGRRVRDAFLNDKENFLDAAIRDDVQSVGDFMMTDGGGMVSVGIGGPITGRGAHLLLVDDYIKNWAEASSETVRDAIWNWFVTTAYNRIEPGGSCIILATRWGVDDLIGRLKKQDDLQEGDGKVWTVIRLPALAEENDPINRAQGEALWSARYTAERLRKIQSVVGEFIFSAMFQQNPRAVADVKANVDMFRIVDDIPQRQLFRFVRSWDIAATDGKRKKKGDHTVGTLMGTDGRPGQTTARTGIFDMVRGKWGPKDVEDNILRTAMADGFGIPVVIEQEPGSSGKAYAEHLATNVLRGFRVTINPPGGVNKWIRAQPYMAAVSHGRIMLLRAAWNEVHKDELKEFPNGKHDDTVDSAGQAYNHLHQTKILVPTWGREPENIQVIRGIGATQLVTGATWGTRHQHNPLQ
jgi:predicted phage terminase large subunit-like protein